MHLIAQPFSKGLGFTDFSVDLALTDLTPEDMVARSRGGEGASIAWALGHLMQYRAKLIEALGGEIDAADLACFGTGADDGAGYPDREALRARWQDVAGILGPLVEGTSDETWLDPERSLVDAANFTVWHEACHMGQVGLMRVERGHCPVSELAVKAMRARAEQA